MKKQRFLLMYAALAALFLAGCGLYTYGKLGGADVTGTYYPENSPADPLGATAENFLERMEFLSGVWYSHYAGIGRLDGYRIGKWGAGGAEFKRIMGDVKLRQILPDAVTSASVRAPTYKGTGSDQSKWPLPDDYWVFYDPAVYGQTDAGVGGGLPAGSESGGFGFLGIVRAVNIFDGDPKRGAVIIEYIKGCAPVWLQKYRNAKDGQVPFFGIYYRVLSDDIVQMANAVDLAAMYAGDPYYTEKETLEDAVKANSIENEAEFISWGVVIPQDREK